MNRIVIGILAVIFLLLLCVVVGLLFNLFYQSQSVDTPQPTPTVILPATATAAPAVNATAPPENTPISVQNTPAPDTPTITPTSTATPLPSPTLAPATDTPIPVIPQVNAATLVNIREGPGTNYAIIGSLLPGTPLPITGKNDTGTWWQVRQEDGTPGWVADSVVQASNTANVPIVTAPAPSEPTPAPPPTQAAPPAFQFEPTGWYGDTNAGLTRFLGTITDSGGNPVNGVTVEAQCGTYRVISNPSGPVPAFGSSDSSNDPPGFYDITIDTKPVPCKWLLTVVHTEDGQTVLAKLSDTFEVDVTATKSIIVANWRKNW